MDELRVKVTNHERGKTGSLVSLNVNIVVREHEMDGIYSISHFPIVKDPYKPLMLPQSSYYPLCLTSSLLVVQTNMQR